MPTHFQTVLTVSGARETNRGAGTRDNMSTTDRGKDIALSVTTITCYFFNCVGKKRSKPLDNTELSAGMATVLQHPTIMYGARFIR